MILYRFNGVRSQTSPGAERSMTADFAAIDVADAWAKILDLLPCDGEWNCQLWKLWSSTKAISLKGRTIIKVTQEVGS